PVENLRGALLPALSLAMGELAVYTRLLRSDMITTLQQDSITMARAKGLPTWRILFRHALRPSSFSLMTVVGVQIGTIVGGAVIVETLFAVPGVGRLLVDSISQRDLMMVQGVALVIAASVVVVNFAVDLLYSLLDPRIRHGRAATARCRRRGRHRHRRGRPGRRRHRGRHHRRPDRPPAPGAPARRRLLAGGRVAGAGPAGRADRRVAPARRPLPARRLGQARGP